jgi:hypothetical protein
MTPKEKAEELVNKFAKLPEEGSLMWYLSFEIAKKCALIAVDEIIDKDGFNNDYWKEVKQELEKL